MYETFINTNPSQENILVKKKTNNNGIERNAFQTCFSLLGLFHGGSTHF